MAYVHHPGGLCQVVHLSPARDKFSRETNKFSLCQAIAQKSDPRDLEQAQQAGIKSSAYACKTEILLLWLIPRQLVCIFNILNFSARYILHFREN